MIVIKDLVTLNGEVVNYYLPSSKDGEIHCNERLVAFPALIDSHVHFRVPGHDYKENWETASRAALRGGITTVIDMPNNHPPCTNMSRLLEKKRMIDEGLEKSQISLQYYLYLGVEEDKLDQMKEFTKTHVVRGIKLYIGGEYGTLSINKTSCLEKIFAFAKEQGLVIAIHAEKWGDDVERCDRKNRKRVMERILHTLRKIPTKVLFVHVSTKEEIELLKKAKEEGLPVFGEVTPHHLILTEKDKDKRSGMVNPPLRDEEDCEILWEAIENRIIDTIASDHAPHMMQEKADKKVVGFPGIETLFPLLLNAYHENKISLDKIVALTRDNVQKLFSIDGVDDLVLVDLDRVQQIQDKELKTKCGWSPFMNKMIRGWPIFTIHQGRVYAASGYSKEYQNMVAGKITYL